MRLVSDKTIKMLLASYLVILLVFSYVGPSTGASFSDSEQSTDNVLRFWIGAVSYTLTAHSESIIISGTDYYQLNEDTPADGTAMTETTDSFSRKEVDRKILHRDGDSSRQARHVFLLTGISEIEASTWTVYYRCRTWGDPRFPKQNNDVNFDIDIVVRKADGTIRTTIASDVADAYLTTSEAETWLTKSATYTFPGYTVVDDSDYLEIIYYGETDNKGPADGPGYMQIRIDDNTLSEADQTRIEGVTY